MNDPSLFDQNSLNDGKLYYSIGEVAQIFDVNVSQIRYWEKEFVIIKPYRNKKGDRFFTKKDIENFKQIYYLTNEKGYTLEGVKRYFSDGGSEKDKQFTQAIELLKSAKQKLLNLKGKI